MCRDPPCDKQTTTPARDFNLYLILKPVAICSNSGGIKIILEIRKGIPKNTSPTVKIIKSWSANNDSKLDMHPILTFIGGMAFFSRKDFTCLDRNGAYCFQMFCADCLDVHWIMRMLRGKLGDGVTIPHYHFLHSIVHHHHISLLSLPNLHIKNDTLCQFFHCLSSASHLLRPWHSPLPQDLAVAVELQQAAPVLHRFAFPKCEGTWIRKVAVVDINGKFQWLYKYKL